MINRGNKIQCKSCGAKYYDLGQKEKPCPKCNNKPIEPSKNKFHKKNIKEETQNKLELDFFYLDNDQTKQITTVLNNKNKYKYFSFFSKGLVCYKIKS